MNLPVCTLFVLIRKVKIIIVDTGLHALSFIVLSKLSQCPVAFCRIGVGVCSERSACHKSRVDIYFGAFIIKVIPCMGVIFADSRRKSSLCRISIAVNNPRSYSGFPAHRRKQVGVVYTNSGAGTQQLCRCLFLISFAQICVFVVRSAVEEIVVIYSAGNPVGNGFGLIIIVVRGVGLVANQRGYIIFNIARRVVLLAFYLC